MRSIMRILAISAFFVVSMYAQKYHVVNVRSNDTLKVRASTNNRTYVVGKLPYNARGIKVQRCVYNPRGNKWCKIRYNNRYYGNTRGWVRAKFLRLSRNNANRPNRPGNIRGKFRVVRIGSNDKLNVRGNAGTRYRKVGSLRHNARNIRVLKCKKDYNRKQWCRISHPSTRTGWVRSSYISRYR